MPSREPPTTKKPIRIISDISYLDNIIPQFIKYSCIVIISKYNSGKSTSATKKIFNYFGKEIIEYITLTDQIKDNKESYIEPTIKFGFIPQNKVIIFDELHADNINTEELNNYISKLLHNNRLIILSNPYGYTNIAKDEINCFIRNEQEILTKKTLFIFVTNIQPK